jgi:hypothetical protein
MEEKALMWDSYCDEVIMGELRALHRKEPPDVGHLHSAINTPNFVDSVFETLFEPHGYTKAQFCSHWLTCVREFETNLNAIGWVVGANEEEWRRMKE